jgi:hypothetical protein
VHGGRHEPVRGAAPRHHRRQPDAVRQQAPRLPEGQGSEQPRGRPRGIDHRAGSALVVVFVVGVPRVGIGGDPFETIHFGLRKYGAYNLKLDRRRSEYFYADTILPAALASVTGSTGGDFHHFDFARVRDTAALDIQLSPATRLSLGLERQTRTGDSTTSLDIERDEFELHRPLDETLDAFTFGVQHAWQRVTLIVEEQLRDFENSSELFLPGASPGQNTTDPAQLRSSRSISPTTTAAAAISFESSPIQPHDSTSRQAGGARTSISTCAPASARKAQPLRAHRSRSRSMAPRASAGT